MSSGTNSIKITELRLSSEKLWKNSKHPVIYTKRKIFVQKCRLPCHLCLGCKVSEKMQNFLSSDPRNVKFLKKCITSCRPTKKYISSKNAKRHEFPFVIFVLGALWGLARPTTLHNQVCKEGLGTFLAFKAIDLFFL